MPFVQKATPVHAAGCMEYSDNGFDFGEVIIACIPRMRDVEQGRAGLFAGHLSLGDDKGTGTNTC